MRSYMHFPPFHHTQMAKDGKYSSMAIHNAYNDRYHDLYTNIGQNRGPQELFG